MSRGGYQRTNKWLAEQIAVDQATVSKWCTNGAQPNLENQDDSKRLADNTLVALTLMIAESRTEEKDVMVKVVVNLINQKNE